MQKEIAIQYLYLSLSVSGKGPFSRNKVSIRFDD